MYIRTLCVAVSPKACEIAYFPFVYSRGAKELYAAGAAVVKNSVRVLKSIACTLLANFSHIKNSFISC
jgi:hypothetical protein